MVLVMKIRICRLSMGVTVYSLTFLQLLGALLATWTCLLQMLQCTLLCPGTTTPVVTAEATREAVSKRIETEIRLQITLRSRAWRRHRGRALLALFHL